MGDVAEAGPVYAACWKAVELRAGVDPLTGETVPDPPSLGVSAADEAALEWALRSAALAGPGARVRVVTAGTGRADAVLRRAASSGAAELVRVDVAADAPSEHVARALAPELAGAELVWCGDASSDRGSGSVPAYLAAMLGRPQALGLVAFELPATGGPLPFAVTRRLDGGRRERLAVEAPAVLSCEGSTARLRRAPLHQVLLARKSVPVVRIGPNLPGPPVSEVRVRPYKPPARVVPPPPGVAARDRIRALTGLALDHAPARAVTLEPDEAAAVILEALEAWGELA